jgi:hypothetical protein
MTREQIISILFKVAAGMVGLVGVTLLVALAWAEEVRADTFDRYSRRTGYSITDTRAGRIDFYGLDGRRLGYGYVTVPPASSSSPTYRPRRRHQEGAPALRASRSKRLLLVLPLRRSTPPWTRTRSGLPPHHAASWTNAPSRLHFSGRAAWTARTAPESAPHTRPK